MGTLPGEAPGRKGADDHIQTAAVARVSPVAPGAEDRAAAFWQAFGSIMRPQAGSSGDEAVESAPSTGDTEPQGRGEPAASNAATSAGGAPDAISRWRQLLNAYDWPIAEVERVMMCESSGRADAESGTNIGLMQINIAAHPYTREQMLDPAQNVAAAYGIWADAGGNWNAWGCRP